MRYFNYKVRTKRTKKPKTKQNWTHQKLPYCSSLLVMYKLCQGVNINIILKLYYTIL